jgi:hypothetical protein
MKYRLFAVILIALSAVSIGAPIAAKPTTVVTSAEKPQLELSIDASFVALPALRFPLQFTDVDRRIFIDADHAKVVHRMIIVQFEKVKSGSHFKFVYRPRPPMNFGKSTYRFGAYVYDDAKEAASQPRMEGERTRTDLEKRGFTVPRLFRTARLARVADPSGQSEVIIFYIENADGDYPSGPLPNADADGDLVLMPSAAKSLFENMKAVIHAVKG